jgi:thioredoxin 1
VHVIRSVAVMLAAVALIVPPSVADVEEASPPIYDEGMDARAEISAARQRAVESGKRVAVVFGADWCGDCRALHAALTHPLVAPIVERAFEVVKVGVGRFDLNVDLGEEVGVPISKGIPAVAILAADGTVLHAQSQGEFARARRMTVEEFASFFRDWAPPGSLER